MKIYYKKSPTNNLLLDLELSDYQYCDSTAQADAIILDVVDNNFKTKYPDGCLIIFPNLWHGVEDGHTVYNDIANKILSVNKNCQLLILSQYQSFPDIKFDNNRVHLLKYDIMLNRQKAYYDQTPMEAHFFRNYSNWYWAGNKSYEINHWPRESCHRSKIFLSIGRISKGREMLARKKIIETLQDHANSGYVPRDIQIVNNNHNYIFYSHREDPISNGNLYFDIETMQVNKLDLFTTVGCQSHGFAPAHVNYYENSFISIYGETIEYGNTIFVTEKTLTPLIQGHFILPFSSSGFVKHLQNSGFKLPDFIDYSYDNITDYCSRLDAYIIEVNRLVSKPLNWWVEQRDKNLEILFFNRKLFWKKPYHQFLPYTEKLLTSTF